MRRAFNDALISAGALVILLLLLVAVDDRVRAQIWQRASSPPSVELSGVVQQVSGIIHVVFEAVRSQSLAHAPMMIFALAATILVLFMLRT
jgi:hypothetical protein